MLWHQHNQGACKGTRASQVGPTTAKSARAHWVCQACGVRTRLEVHHVVKRAQGGSDFDLDRLVALCYRCHAETDAPYARGRLVVMPSAGGRFIFELWEGTSKETRQVVERWENR